MNSVDAPRRAVRQVRQLSQTAGVRLTIESDRQTPIVYRGLSDSCRRCSRSTTHPTSTCLTGWRRVGRLPAHVLSRATGVPSPGLVGLIPLALFACALLLLTTTERLLTGRRKLAPDQTRRNQPLKPCCGSNGPWVGATGLLRRRPRRGPASQFNDRATSLARRPGGAGVGGAVNNMIGLLTGGPVADTAGGTSFILAISCQNVGAVRTMFTAVEVAAKSDTVSAAEETCTPTTTVVGGQTGRLLSGARRTAAASPNGVLAALSTGQTCGPLGDDGRPSRFYGACGSHVAVQHHQLLEQHLQQQSRPHAGHEGGDISRHCRGPPPAGNHLQQADGREHCT